MNGTLGEESWEMIVLALRDYVIRKEEVLKTQNAGDREWQELSDFSALATDIENYVLWKNVT